jgi:pimeloyl-ACP methyl ester carboxylesterase
MWPSLSEKFHLITLDFLGFGFSDKPYEHQYSIIEQASIVEALLEHLDISDYHLLAHDYGNSVAQELMARDQERDTPIRILSVVFLNGGLFIEATRPRLIQRLLISPIGKYLSPFLSRNTLKKNFHRIFGADYLPTEEEIDQWWSLITYNNGKSVFHKLIRYMAERVQYRERWVGALQQAPVLIRFIYGPEDPVSGIPTAERYKALVPQPDVVPLVGVGHYPSTEVPHLVVKHYLECYDML